MQAAVPYCYISKRMIDKFNELKDKTDEELMPKVVPEVEEPPQKSMPSKLKSKKAAPVKKAPPQKMKKSAAPIVKEPEPVSREIVANLSDEEIAEDDFKSFMDEDNEESKET